MTPLLRLLLSGLIDFTSTETEDHRIGHSYIIHSIKDWKRNKITLSAILEDRIHRKVTSLILQSLVAICLYFAARVSLIMKHTWSSMLETFVHWILISRVVDKPIANLRVHGSNCYLSWGGREEGRASLLPSQRWVYTYVTSDIVDDNSLLLGHSTSFAAWGNAKSTGLCDGVGSDCGVRWSHMLWQHSILVQLSDSKYQTNTCQEAYKTQLDSLEQCKKRIWLDGVETVGYSES